MSAEKEENGVTRDIYQQLTLARNYLRTVDDFYARAAASHNTTLEHYQALLAVHCLGETDVPLRVLAQHMVRDRTATSQLCRRMQQIDLLSLNYESNSHRPQLLVSLNQRGKEAIEAITEDGLKNRDTYLQALHPDKRQRLAEAVRFSWLDGLENNSAPRPGHH